MLQTLAKRKPAKDSATAFGARLRTIREAKGLTLQQLGEKIGMHFTAVSRLERGANQPTWPTVLKLAEALEVEPNDFLAGDDEPGEDEPKKGNRKK